MIFFRYIIEKEKRLQIEFSKLEEKMEVDNKGKIKYALDTHQTESEEHLESHKKGKLRA